MKEKVKGAERERERKEIEKDEQIEHKANELRERRGRKNDKKMAWKLHRLS